MNFDLSDEHRLIRDTVRDFARAEVAPVAEELDRTKSFPYEIVAKLGGLGLMGIPFPEQYGGAGAEDFRFNAVLEEELAKVGAAYPTCVGIHTDITSPYIVELGTEEQKRRWLPKVASGEIVLAIGMTEPSGGSDLAALRTTAVRDGDGWVINGSKTFITNGYSADLVIVAARTDPEKGPKGITLFGVEATQEGFSRGRKLDKVGMEESDTAELFFENVRVTDAEIVGELNMGFIHMMQKLAQERLSCAVANVAHAKQILVETLAYAKDRKAFGQSIGNFQHNKFLLAQLFTQIEVAEAYIDKCVLAHSRGELSAVEASKAKYWSSQTQSEVLDHCVQLHGGYGFMNEYRVARAWRDARVTKIWAGSNEIMKEIIGRDLGL